MEVGFYHERAAHSHDGGISTFVQEMAIAMTDSHSVSLYGAPGEVTPRLADSDVEVVEIPPLPRAATLDGILDATTPLSEQLRSKLLTFASGYRGSLVDHVEANVDVLLTHQWLDELLLSNAVDVPVVHESHGVRSAGFGSRLRERFAKTDFYLANSEHTADRFREQFGRPVDGVVYPGVDADRFSPAATLAFRREPFTVLYVGRVVELKGIYDLLAAVASVDGVHLHVVGSGEVDRLRDRAARLGATGDLSFERPVPHGRLPGYYAAADAVCVPAHAESFGMVNLEAMACAIPVVATDVGGVGEYAADGENALLVPAGDPDAIADALERLRSNPSLRRAIGRAARETAEGFTWSDQAARLADFCETFVGSGTPSGPGRRHRPDPPPG